VTGLSEHTTLNTTIFVVVLVVTLVLVYRVATRNATTADYFAARRSFGSGANGLAITGDYLSAGTILGGVGLAVLGGLDTMVVLVAAALTWPLGAVLFSEQPRNVGQYTISDVLAFRMRQRPVRAATATVTLVVSLLYLTSQMAAAGSMIALLLNVSSLLGKLVIITVVGTVMITYVLVGGMRGTTYVQIIKAALVLAAFALITVFLLGRFGFDIPHLLSQANSRTVPGREITRPGLLFPGTTAGRLDLISAVTGLVLGGATVPHVMMRYFTVSSGKQARKSAAWATLAICGFYLTLALLGYGALALVGGRTIATTSGGGNAALPLLAFEIGGSWLLGVICAVAFMATLAVVAGVTLTVSATVAQDVYGTLVKRGEADGPALIRVARIVAVLVGLLAIAAGTLAVKQNVALLVIIALSLSASALVAPILYTLYWRRFTTRGTVWAIWGGLLAGLVVVAFSHTVSGAPDAWLPQFDFAFVPIKNPAIIGVPASFLLGFLGTVLSRPENEGRTAELEVRALTGIGSS
jgi:cation/acetate symporter